MSHNLGLLSKEEKDKMAVDKAAAGVVYCERNGLDANDLKTELEQPEHLRSYFRERYDYYKKAKVKFK